MKFTIIIRYFDKIPKYFKSKIKAKRVTNRVVERIKIKC